MTIKAIETKYAGCRFRSRLEARWAVFFDHMGIKWEYESEGYPLPSGYYLPDFWLPVVEANGQSGIWFEVKPALDLTVTDPRWADLVEATKKSLVLTLGLPRPDGDVIWDGPGYDGYMQEWSYWSDSVFDDGTHTTWDNGRAFVRCPTCRLTGLVFEGRLERLSCGHHGQRHGANEDEILRSYTAARSARFEHGERG